MKSVQLRPPGFVALVWAEFLGTLNDNLLKMVVTLMAVAMVGALVARRIAHVPPSRSGAQFPLNPWRETGIGLRRLASDRALWPAVTGMTCFESLGALAMLNMLLVGKEVMMLDDARLGPFP